MAYTDREDLNYIGELFIVGQSRTPFLNSIGGINGANSKITNAFTHPVAQPYSLASASQPAITEAQSVTGQTAGTVVRTQEFNTVQIFQKAVSVSYAKQATFGEISGLSQLGSNPVINEMAFQKMAALKQIAVDYEYSLLNGVYQLGNAATTAAKMRGLITAVTTNTTAAANVALAKTHIDTVLKSMADNGAPFENMVLICNAFQKQALTKLYGYAPEDRNIAGINVNIIETDFCRLSVMYVPNVPAATIGLIDMNYLYPVFCPVPNKGLLFYEDMAPTGASVNGQIYGQIGIDYGPQSFHGSITGLKTS